MDKRSWIIGTAVLGLMVMSPAWLPGSSALSHGSNDQIIITEVAQSEGCSMQRTFAEGGEISGGDVYLSFDDFRVVLAKDAEPKAERRCRVELTARVPAHVTFGAITVKHSGRGYTQGKSPDASQDAALDIVTEIHVRELNSYDPVQRQHKGLVTPKPTRVNRFASYATFKNVGDVFATTCGSTRLVNIAIVTRAIVKHEANPQAVSDSFLTIAAMKVSLPTFGGQNGVSCARLND